MSDFLKLHEVSKSYGGGPLAVDRVTLAINEGEFVTFLGPSGSGKTSTLMMIAGFEVPTVGDITLKGHSIAQIPPHRRDFGIVFQNYALFPHMTVAENVRYPLRMRKTAAIEADKRIARVLDMVGLAAYAARYPAALSGGQQQRVALARALVFEPAMVLMDEPLGALDKNLREQMQIEIKAIQRKLGVTMLYVTHDQGEAITMSDRIAVFNNGRIEQAASPAEIYHRPSTVFVGEFVGDSNMLPGKLVDATTGRVETTHGVLQAAPVPGFKTGEAVVAMIRPEALELAPTNTSPSHNALAFEARHLLDFGGSVVVTGDCAGKPLRIRLRSRSGTTLTMGQRYTAYVARDEIHLIRPPAGG